MDNTRRWAADVWHRSRARTAAALAIAGVAVCAGTLAAPAVGARDDKERRIVGGDVAPPGAYPWAAALVDARRPAERGQFCGGSLVRPRIVLTAAHCVAGLAPRELDVVVGRDRLSSRDGERLDVARVGGHPDADLFAAEGGTVPNDAAQVKLTEPAGILPVALAAPEDAALFAPGQPARVLGWGLVKERGVEAADELRQADVSIVSDADCAEAYPGFSRKSQICAAGPERDACQGDSGGPLIVSDAEGGWIQVGVVSAGRGCARAKFPGVYTEVAMLLEFIDDRHPTFAPYSAGHPRISGRPEPGRRLRCHRGRWVGGDMSVSFLWAIMRRGEPRIIVGVGWFWRVIRRFEGERVTCLVFGTNEGGFSTARAPAERLSF